MHRNTILRSIFILISVLTAFTGNAQPNKAAQAPEPKIVNIVNFIRLLEPRDAKITQDVLYQTVVQQVKLMNQYKLGGTFLLQYDALMDSRYQQLLKKLPKGSFEIGGWWEIPQPLVEKAGLKWRGRYPWDWHADVGFSTGYTPAEREKLIDVYMADFKAIFGYYPRTIASWFSWFIDAHSLNYMYDKYKIVASANCKDQYGTDGYTLWGGYWNQAYYPSRINSYMPAQHAEKQLPVPVFRLLGSDPIRQYDTGVSSARQGVITLEPVYPKAGGSEEWIKWFFTTFTNDPALNFNYTQAGQENSFTWPAMQKGLELQMPLMAHLKKAGKIRVETMEQSALWFKKNYAVTPATSFAVTKDIAGSDQKTIWYNSRFYRLNLLWEDNTLRIRDIHLFNEKIADKYTTEVAQSNECSFFTLPVVDGYLWSKRGKLAGLRLMTLVNGKETPVKGGDPTFTNVDKSTVHVSWPAGEGSFELDINERSLTVLRKGKPDSNWYLDLTVADGITTPITTIEANWVNYTFENHPFHLMATKGSFEKPANGAIFRLKPQGNSLALSLVDQ